MREEDRRLAEDEEVETREAVELSMERMELERLSDLEVADMT